MTKRNIRNYDNEFKSNAVSLYISSGKSYPQLGSELGIAPPSTLAG
jgi:transposase